ncbi:MAG: DUF423 domain-containing protein [Proteobacteria bacterium]|nr:DUF423 domain-containing protein [Pseudomonadota bacterium]
MLGAFAAHTLRARLTPELLTTFETGVKYQMYHALVLLIVALVPARRRASTLLTVSGGLFVVGTLLFSGSLSVLTVCGMRWFGSITPVGGMALIIGSFCLVVLALAGRRRGVVDPSPPQFTSNSARIGV